MRINRIFLASLIAVTVIGFLISISIPFVEANQDIPTDSYTNESTTEIISLGEGIGIAKSSLVFHASPDNKLPWGFVEGKIANHVADYPVIIQIYNKDGQPVHFAQTDVAEDGSYEYKFRVRNVNDDGQVINIFDGDYQVKIFKVIYLDSGSNQV